jgi:general secretion pathway protein F
MARYRYEAITPEGELLHGEMEAPDQAAVVKRIQLAGRIPVRAEPAEFELLRRPAGPRRMAQRDLAVFTRELASLVHAGLTVDRALQIIIEVSRNRRVRRLAVDIQQAVRGGCALSDALQAQRGVFSGFYVNMVRAAEAGGTLDAGLARIAEHEEKNKALRESVITALIYPGILVTVAGASLLVLLAYVVPQFTALFADAGRALPVSTRIVIGAAEILRSFWPAAAVACIGLVLLLRRYRRHGVMLRLPLVGELVGRMEMARLSRSLATLLASGVSLIAGLYIVKDILSNRELCQALDIAADHLKAGGRLADGLASTGLFPALGLQMIKVGEESGRLEEMLQRVAEIYDQEVAAATQRMLRLLEPALVVAMGALMGAAILSVLAAIASLKDLPL